MFLDEGIGVIKKACEECGYVLLVTADHGNAERMIDEDGKPVTKHTTYRGECFYCVSTHVVMSCGEYSVVFHIVCSVIDRLQLYCLLVTLVCYTV